MPKMLMSKSVPESANTSLFASLKRGLFASPKTDLFASPRIGLVTRILLLFS